MPDFFPVAAEMLKSDEGFSSTAYLCTAGYLTAGYGRNLDTNGVSRDEAEIMLVNDMIACLDDLETFRWWGDLNDARKAAVLNMRFQLGKAGFRGFKRTIHYLDKGLYHHAALECLDSKWAKADSPERAQRISKIIDMGEIIPR